MDFIVDLHHRRTAAILPFPVISSFSSNFSSSLSLCPHFFHSNLASTKLNFHVSHIHYGSGGGSTNYEEIFSAPIIIKVHYNDSHIYGRQCGKKKRSAINAPHCTADSLGNHIFDFLNEPSLRHDDDMLQTGSARSDAAHVQQVDSKQRLRVGRFEITSPK